MSLLLGNTEDLEVQLVLQWFCKHTHMYVHTHAQGRERKLDKEKSEDGKNVNI